MYKLAALLLCATLAACTGRQVEVTTTPDSATTPAPAATLRVTNNLTQPVNVYVVTKGTELFVRQVAAQSTEDLTVQGVAPGTSVTLRARQVDGRQVYERPDVVIGQGTFDWRVP